MMASVYMLFITQTSSMTLAKWGMALLRWIPEAPCRANLKVLGAKGKEACPEVLVVLRSAG